MYVCVTEYVAIPFCIFLKSMSLCTCTSKMFVEVVEASRGPPGGGGGGRGRGEW